MVLATVEAGRAAAQSRFQASLAAVAATQLANTSGVLQTLQAFKSDWELDRANRHMWVDAQSGAFGMLWHGRLADMASDRLLGRFSGRRAASPDRRGRVLEPEPAARALLAALAPGSEIAGVSVSVFLAALGVATINSSPAGVLGLQQFKELVARLGRDHQCFAALCESPWPCPHRALTKWQAAAAERFAVRLKVDWGKRLPDRLVVC